jgi:hypothetical protein
LNKAVYFIDMVLHQALGMIFRTVTSVPKPKGYVQRMRSFVRACPSTGVKLQRRTRSLKRPRSRMLSFEHQQRFSSTTGRGSFRVSRLSTDV